MRTRAPVVLFAALREPTYVRNLVTLRAIKRAGVEVIECTSVRQSYPARLAEVLAKLCQALIRRQFDIVVLGFLAQPLFPFVRLLTRRPIIVDAFISLYDTLCHDRRRLRPRSLGGRLMYWIDRYSFTRADLLVVDTVEDGEYFQDEFAASRDKIHVIPVGADDGLFRERPPPDTAYNRTVFYYASGLPVHGLPHVIEAARHVEADGIHFRIACPPGLVDDPPSNVTLLGVVPVETLAAEMGSASVVLAGHFSVLPKAQRVVAGKTYQALACARPTIVSNLPANSRVLDDRVTAFFCEPERAASIAMTVKSIISDPVTAARVAKQGRRLYETSWHVDALSPLWREVIRGAVEIK